MKTIRLAFASFAGIAGALYACGGISDPSLRGSQQPNVATISGALSASNIDPNAHVALVWRAGKSGGLVVAGDAPIVDGKFTMNVPAPPDAWLFPVEGEMSVEESPPSSPPPSADVPPPSPGTDPGGGGAKGMTPQNVSGGITTELQGAAAGFVVYVDANGNNALDVEGETGSSPDQILGGNKELVLAYLTGGGQLAYEKLRDKTGAAPAPGFNLLWRNERWLSLDLVELEISQKHAKLPSGLCYGGGSGAPGAPPPPDEADEGNGNSGGFGPGSYPPSSDPRLTCDPDGRGFYYVGCDQPPAPPPGLCSADATVALPCPATYHSLPPGPVPADWPCYVTPLPVKVDGGADSGS